jgi:NarL family two-component system response regulator LiaR
MTEKARITVLIVEDQLITRLGLRIVIERFPDLEIVGEAENGQAAVELAGNLKPSVIVMDVGMPVMDGIEATKRIKEIVPETNVLILTSHDHDDDVFAALAAGADGYCLKDASADNLGAAIRGVSHGASWLDPAIAKRVLRASADRQSKPAAAADKKSDKFALSARENEVLELLVDGLTNQQMAERLLISNETVKTHMRHVMEKLAVADRTQAAVKALRDGLLLSRQSSGR